MTRRLPLLFPLFSLMGALTFSTPTWAQDWTLKPVTSLQKLTASAPGELRPFTPTPIQMEAARGEWENFQFVVTAGKSPIENLEVHANGLSTITAEFIPSTDFQFFRENFVFVAHPSGNRDVRPQWWPDALIPLEKASQHIDAGKSAVCWGSFKIPDDAILGDYYGELDILANGQPRRLALILSVRDQKLPAPTFRATVALYYDTLRDWYKKAGQTFTDDEWAEQKKRYYNFLLDYRINAYDLPVSWDSPEVDGYLKDPRVLSVRTPQLDSSDFTRAIEKFKATGTLGKAFYYWIDEPTPDQYTRVQETTKKLRALGIKHLVTAAPNQGLKNGADIWCPNIGDWFGTGHLDWKALASERAAGRETWLYTMVQPRWPYPTWLLDDDATSIRQYGPLWAQNGINGFVYSMCHGWGPKPLENLESFAGTNGDGTLLYPAETVGGSGPMPSIRLMLLRDAIEDYELMRAYPKFDWRPHLASLASKYPQPNLFPVQPTRAIVPAAGSGVLAFHTGLEGLPARESQTLTSCRWQRQKDSLSVWVEAPVTTVKESVAVELAPVDATEKWRFILTTKGNKAVERRTHEGSFQLPDFEFEANTRAVPAARAGQSATQKFFFKIPLADLPFAKADFRFDVMRLTRTDEGATMEQRLTDGGFDLYSMPLMQKAK